MPARRSGWFDSWAERLDRRKGWDRVSTPVGLLLLKGIQNRLRRQNLYDTDSVRPVADSIPASPPDGALTSRTIDGTFNDIDMPAMGSAGTRFGRNVPLADVFPEPEERLLSPDPRVVSRELLTRDVFQPAMTLNMLAAAWIQFEVHDWVDHGKADWDTAYRFALQEGDPWPEDPMRIPRAHRDPTWIAGSLPPTYLTADSHWWDGSQVYGNDPAFAAAIRTGEGGKLKVGPDGLPPSDVAANVDLSGVAGNFWVGLALLHGLFMKEHNAICDMLRGEHPDWGDDQLYAKARLINAALMAKIHTVEWTPAIIAHPTSQAAMRVDWWGVVGPRVVRRFGHFSRWDLLTGAPGSKKNHNGVPYTLTEEFTSVYRLHPLIPDEFTFRSPSDDRVIAEHPFPDLGVLQVRDRMNEIGLMAGFYSFGVSNPGAIQLHNFPRFLQEFHRADGTVIDLAATDVLRIRERGVPRYNRFRELFHKAPVRTFEELTPNPRWREELQRVYGSVDEVDLMVGLYAEPPPKGFGFSDTAFRVFALMAPRRLKSDRFFTTDYTPRMYTPAGLRWVDDNSMVTVLLRHFPELAPALRGVTNAFAPWNRVGGK